MAKDKQIISEAQLVPGSFTPLAQFVLLKATLDQMSLCYDNFYFHYLTAPVQDAPNSATGTRNLGNNTINTQALGPTGGKDTMQGVNIANTKSADLTSTSDDIRGTDINSGNFSKYTFLCLCKDEFSKQLAFTFLSELKNEFVKNHPVKVSGLLEKYQHSQVELLKNEIEHVKKIMSQNITSVLERGELIDNLVERTGDLDAEGLAFRQTSAAVSRRMWVAKYRTYLLSFLVVVLLIFGLWIYLK